LKEILCAIGTTEVFRSLTCAQPERVWDELTATRRPLGWLYGMVVESTWEKGASVRVGMDRNQILFGEVLTAERPQRLSFTLGDTPCEPSVFITWELACDVDTTIVRLTIDETQPRGDATREIELAWIPVIHRLTGFLAEQATTTKSEPKDRQN
jgi:uncharacterized protein YndB with AHSA1/START domain